MIRINFRKFSAANFQKFPNSQPYCPEMLTTHPCLYIIQNTAVLLLTRCNCFILFVLDEEMWFIVSFPIKQWLLQHSLVFWILVVWTVKWMCNPRVCQERKCCWGFVCVCLHCCWCVSWWCLSTCRISTSSVSGSSADEAGSCEDRDAIGLDLPMSGFTPHSHHSPAATTSAISSSSPSPSFAFRCISSNDSVESRPASECSAPAAVHDDTESIVELSSGACDQSSVLWPKLGRLLRFLSLFAFLTLLFSWLFC